ncbi:MFS transporter [Streptomyces sp. HNM0575]|uniref:MFS transporter n=1 Tax=Streptomyces sp. HNM0575 TaxID=2716338 RepID=UPI00145DA8D2|nr:MFS transporter [Streptomyces sp. HNM0575]NLU71808.1 MFS transporter [Streptomyces sp. HNM0575]
MSAYGDVLRSPAARRLVIATGSGKFGFAAFPLATVLLAHGESGSFVDAGLAAGAWGIGGTLTAPVRGFLVDRHGPRIPLTVLTSVTLLAVGGLATASDTTALVIFGAVAGASAPPIVASIRPLWKHAVRAGLVRTAYAMDAILTEAAKICGPLLAAGAAAWSPQIGVAAAGTLLILGAMLLVVRPTATSDPAPPNVAGARAAVQLRPALRLLLLANAALGFCLGALTVGLPARAAEHGSAAGSGWLLACLGLGSALSGIWFGSRRQGAPVRGYIAGFAWLGLVLAVAAVAPMGLPLAGVLLIAGGAFAPITICLFELLDQHAPRGTEVSSLMWMVSSEELGIALGAMPAGVQAQDAGAGLVLITAAVSAGLGAVVLAGGGRILARR